MPLGNALDRVLADDVISTVDVPGFDRSNVDGYALQAKDSFGAMEEAPRRLRLEQRGARTGDRACDAGRAGSRNVRSQPAECSPAAPTPS